MTKTLVVAAVALFAFLALAGPASAQTAGQVYCGPAIGYADACPDDIVAPIDNGVQPTSTGTLLYTGSGETTNRIINLAVINLAGVPSIVYGMLGLAVFVRVMEPLTSGSMFGVTDANGPVLREVEQPLTADGFSVLGFSDPRSVKVHLRTGAGDAVLIDSDHVGQPAQLVAEIAQLTSKPILMIRPIDQGFDLDHHGPHDFVARDPRRDPAIHPQELRARLSMAIHYAAHRPRPSQEWLSVGGVTIDMNEHSVWKDDRRVELTRTEYQLLLCLVANTGELLSHDDLLRCVWSRNQCGQVHYLRTYLCRLRKRLGWTGAGGGPSIQSVRGEGYRLLLGDPESSVRSVGPDVSNRPCSYL